MSKINMGLIGNAQWCFENDGPKKRKVWSKTLANVFFAFRHSISVQFAKFKNWNLQIYQTKLTICLKLIWNL